MSRDHPSNPSRTGAAGVSVPPTREIRRLTRESRAGLWLLSGFLVLIGFPLVVLSGETDRYFAWTIEPPLSAATLGAFYWGSVVLVASSARQHAWANARVVVPGIVVAGTFLLLATLIHLDRFHMGRATGWIWLVLYAVMPLGAIAMVFRETRQPGVDPPRTAPLPIWVKVALGLQAAVLVGLGAALFVAPTDVASVWPWTLTPLMARALGAWMMALGAS